jgi:hypothetical protein
MRLVLGEIHAAREQPRDVRQRHSPQGPYAIPEWPLGVGLLPRTGEVVDGELPLPYALQEGAALDAVGIGVAQAPEPHEADGGRDREATAVVVELLPDLDEGLPHPPRLLCPQD